MDARIRIVISVAIIGFVSGVVSGAWVMREDPVRSTYAGLFSEPIVDLVLEREGGVNGFIGRTNLAYGDRASGSILVLSNLQPIDWPKQTWDLDIDVRGELLGRSGPDRIDDFLIVTRLSYGRDDLLSSADGGADLIREIDQNPVVGNGDGRLSLREFGAGVNDLPPPKQRDYGGSPFNIDVTFLPRDGADVYGQSFRAHFIFQLSEVTEADLN